MSTAVNDKNVAMPPSSPGLDAPLSKRTRARTKLMGTPSVWTFGLLVLLMATFTGLVGPRFLTVFNLRNILIDTSGLVIIAVAMTFVIIVAGIDLSVGAVLVFSGVIGAQTMLATAGSGIDLWLGLVTTLVAGLGWGIINGVLVARASLPPLIVTLGTLSMALGLAYVISGGFDVRGVPPELTQTLGLGSLFSVLPFTVLIAAIVTVLGWLLLTQTRFGRHTFAIGSNIEAARRAGINVERHLILVYAMSGFLAGLAGFLNLARFQTTTISGHSNDILQAITAVTLGGTSLFGGVGTIVGTVIGAFIPAVLRNGLVIVGIQPFWQQVVVGAILIAVVYADQLRRRGRDRN